MKGGNGMNLGKRIVKIRKENQLSQEDFAELFHVTRQTISSWENSKSYPDIETLVKISDNFHISLDILLREDTDMIDTYKKERKQRKIFKQISIILAIIIMIIVLGIVSMKYYEHSEQEKIKHDYEVVTKNIEKLGFQEDSSLPSFLILTDHGITYALEKPYAIEKYGIGIYAYTNYKKNIGFMLSNESNSKLSVYFYKEKVTLDLKHDGTLIDNSSSKTQSELYTKNKDVIMDMVQKTKQYRKSIEKGI